MRLIGAVLLALSGMLKEGALPDNINSLFLASVETSNANALATKVEALLSPAASAADSNKESSIVMVVLMSSMMHYKMSSFKSFFRKNSRFVLSAVNVRR